MIPEGTDAKDITPEQIDLVVHQIELFCTEQNISRKQLARAIGLKSAGNISDVLNGNYKADRRPLIQQLDAWLEQELKRLATPSDCRFVWTTVAREIQTVAQLAVALKVIGLVYGGDTSGVGKTMALEAVHAETPGSIFITIEKQHANATGVWRAIAQAMRINDGKGNAALYDRIKGELRDTPRLLIVDQIHNLRGRKDDGPLYLLADLYDMTNHAPQLWCGTADMVGYLNRGVKNRGDESLAQLRRRIGIQRDLMQRTRSPEEGGKDEPLYTVEDIRRVFAANKLKIAADGVQFLWRLACIPDHGALGLARNVVRIATIIAQHQGASAISGDLLKSALNDCVQPLARKDIYRQISERGAIARAG
jgi:transcriptional regulator with XRE-family HTH domain